MTPLPDAPSAHRFPGKPRVIVTRRLMPAVEARMRDLFDVRLNPDDRSLDRAELVAAMREADVLVPTVTDRIDAGMFVEALDGQTRPGQLPPRLALIASFGMGTDHLDLDAARARRIVVTNTPGVFTDDTADLTMALIIAAPRRLASASRSVLNGQWPGWGPCVNLGHKLGGKRLAIIGMGRIGQAVAHRARAFGLEVVYHNRHRLPAALENMLGARFEPDLDAMIAAADILALHCPGGADTRGILSAARIASLKPEAYVINTARGDLIDEEALIDALKAGRIGGAGLDVFTNEPAIDPRFLTLPNVVVMPHLGSGTMEGRETAGLKVVANIRAWADGHRPPDQVLPTRR